MQIFLKRPLSMIVGVQGFKGFVNNPCFTVQLIKVKMIFVDYWQLKDFLFLQLLKDKEQLKKQLADAVVKTEALEQEKQKQEEDARFLNRQLSETHENEVLLLKEELQTKNTEVVTAKTSEEQLNAKIAQLVQEKQNLATECEIQKTELARRWVLDMNIHATDNWGLNCFLLATMEVKSIGTFSSGISKTRDRSPPNLKQSWILSTVGRNECFFGLQRFWLTRWLTFNFSLLVISLLNFKTLPMNSVEIKQNHQQVKKVLIVKQTLTRSTFG